MYAVCHAWHACKYWSLCVYVCMYVCIVCPKWRGMHASIEAYMYMYVFMYALYAQNGVHASIEAYVCMYACLHVCMHCMPRVACMQVLKLQKTAQRRKVDYWAKCTAFFWKCTAFHWKMYCISLENVLHFTGKCTAFSSHNTAWHDTWSCSTQYLCMYVCFW